MKGLERIICFHHTLGVRIHYSSRQSPLHCTCKESAVYYFSVGKPKGNVGNTKRCMASQITADDLQSLQSNFCSLRICADSHSKGVKYYIFLVNAVFSGNRKDFFGDFYSSVHSRRDSIIVKSKGDYQTSVFFNQRENSSHGLFFAADGIYHRFAVIKTQSRFHGSRICSIYLKRQIYNCLQFKNSLFQHSFFIDIRQADIYVEDINTTILLPYSFLQNIVYVIIFKSLLETFLSCGIYAFTYQYRGILKFHRMSI